MAETKILLIWNVECLDERVGTVAERFLFTSCPSFLTPRVISTWPPALILNETFYVECGLNIYLTVRSYLRFFVVTIPKRLVNETFPVQMEMKAFIFFNVSIC